MDSRRICMNETTKASLVDDFGVDFRRPVFGQLDGLGDRYWDWVHDHVGPARRQALAAHDPAARWPGSFPIFANPWLEANTHISWRLVVSLWVPTVVLLIAGAAWRDVAWRQVAGFAAGGFLLWTLVEYVLHRAVFHHLRGPRSAARSTSSPTASITRTRGIPPAWSFPRWRVTASRWCCSSSSPWRCRSGRRWRAWPVSWSATCAMTSATTPGITPVAAAVCSSS